MGKRAQHAVRQSQRKLFAWLHLDSHPFIISHMIICMMSIGRVGAREERESEREIGETEGWRGLGYKQWIVHNNDLHVYHQDQISSFVFFKDFPTV